MLRRVPLFVGFALVLVAGGCASSVKTETAALPSAHLVTATGPWKASHVPSPQGAVHASLVAVSCLSTTACEAVGNYVPFSGVSEPFAEVWNGTGWAVQSMLMPPGAGPIGAMVRGVSCAGTICLAVGNYETTTGAYSLFGEQLNGSTWSLQAIAPPTDYLNQSGQSLAMTSDSCSSPTSCLAVGWYNSADGGQNLTYQWNGASWSYVTNQGPNPGKSVSCSPSGFCEATDNIHAYQWNDGSWSQQPLPDPDDAFSTVSCASATFCAALGPDTAATVPTDDAAVWNGASWSQVPNLSFGYNGANLDAITCSTNESCVAVGTLGLSAINYGIPLAEQVTLTGWRTQVTPHSASAPLNDLFAVACDPSFAKCFAVGDTAKTSPGPVTPVVLTAS